MQQTLWQIHRRLRSLRDAAALVAWTFRIVTRACLRMLRMPDRDLDMDQAAMVTAKRREAAAWRIHQEGRVRMLAVASRKRSSLVPDVPTVEEAIGLRGFEAELWSLLAVRKGVPEPIVRALNAAMLRALASPEVQAEFRAAGIEPPTPMYARSWRSGGPSWPPPASGWSSP